MSTDYTTSTVALAGVPSPAGELRDFVDEVLDATFEPHFYQPDTEAVRAGLAAVAAHELTDGPPVWPMFVAPPGSAKTTIINPIERLPNVHSVDKLTVNTLLSGQIGNNKSSQKKESTRDPSLLRRIGPSGILTIPDFSTVLSMKHDDRASILADFRRIFDGQLRREVGTSEEPLEWRGRITLLVAVTPAIDGYHSVFQALGERWLLIRWHRPGGEDSAEGAALAAMNQNAEEMRTDLQLVTEDLLYDLPVKIAVDRRHQEQIAALAEFVVRARTYVDREQNSGKTVKYHPESEAPTRLSQQLLQLAKGSARLRGRNSSHQVTERDMSLVRRVAFDCIPSIRWRFLTGGSLPPSTRQYVKEDLKLVGLVNDNGNLSDRTKGLLERAGVDLTKLKP